MANSKAVEALAKSTYERRRAGGEKRWDELPECERRSGRLAEAKEDLRAAEPHIRADERRKVLTELAEIPGTSQNQIRSAEAKARSQVLTELAEEFERRADAITQTDCPETWLTNKELGRIAGLRDVVAHCRELAAKETH